MAQSSAAEKAAPSSKDRLLLKIKWLDPRDDEKTSISKKVSWILRHGAKAAAVPQDADRWVKFSDLCECSILAEYSPDLIWKVIIDSNGKKLRYQIDESGGRSIRTYPKHKEDQKQEKEAVVEASSPSGSPAAVPDLNQQMQFQVAMAAAAQYWQSCYMTYMMQQQAQASVFSPVDGKYYYQGRIKSINKEKNFGFVECPYTYALYKRDVFLYKTQLGDLQVGDYVKFSVEANKQGMPQARDVLPSGWFGEGKGTEGGKDGKGKGKGRGKGGKKGKGESKGENKDSAKDAVKAESVAADKVEEAKAPKADVTTETAEATSS